MHSFQLIPSAAKCLLAGIQLETILCLEHEGQIFNRLGVYTAEFSLSIVFQTRLGGTEHISCRETSGLRLFW